MFDANQHIILGGDHNEGKPTGDELMQIDNHNLVNELPEFKDKIHALKTSDRHFHKLFDEYNTIDTDVHRLESEDSPVSDEHMESLKKQRLLLKDQLYAMLTAS